MRSYSLLAPAKINLYLEIVGDRPDGYHELVMILQTISLCDRINLLANCTDAIRIHCDHPQLPPAQHNLAYKAAQLMVKQFPDAFAQYGGVEITIDKQIPVAAGLAGGSTDAAAVLVGMSKMWQLGLTLPELQTLATKLGSDVPFCVTGGTAIATGRGEQLDFLNGLDNLAVVLAKHRHLEISTAWAYQTYRQQFGSESISKGENGQSGTAQIHSEPLVKAITQENGIQIGQLLHNDLQKVVLPALPEVAQLRKAFQREGILGTMMSGSGSTVFALCDSQLQAQQIKQDVKAEMNDPDLYFWIAQFSSAGIQVLA
ncbi:MAG: 4-(cytidine 5'-diphospho)-2-C-methyl-D-erythritol kinase [Cyanobacteria bacterium QS_3_48_167]|nr:MAG: 4-(cytidine 5'-diphospho)-2-C-methyl-D-erythritol kinase [Cyanobacteria bacterium QS_3_48_167]